MMAGREIIFICRAVKRTPLWWSIAAKPKKIKKAEIKEKVKMKIKKMKKRKKYDSEKNPTKLSWPMSAKSDT